MNAMNALISEIPDGIQPILLAPPALRAKLRSLLHRNLPQLKVISRNEIAPEFKVHSVAFVQLDSRLGNCLQSGNIASADFVAPYSQ